MKQKSDLLLIGAHVSVEKGLHLALHRGRNIGATAIQIFTRNQKRWQNRSITPEEAALWEKAKEETGIYDVMSHDSYLINLGSPDPEILHKSQLAFQEEIERCHALKIRWLNFHPGSATSSTEEACLDTIVHSLLSLEKQILEGNTHIVLEATAGQGSSVGWKFEHLGYIIQNIKKRFPLGVCIDTCHIFAAGYDIRTLNGWKTVLKEFDEKIGLCHLVALHVNDSLKPLGSRRDRHACLGEGLIGLESFKAMMHLPQLACLPMFLETPEGEPIWTKEIQLLRQFYQESHTK